MSGYRTLQLKHLSKEAIRKIAHKQMLCRIHKHTGNVEEYKN